MASKRAQRRQCQHKVAYPTRSAAFAALHRHPPEIAYRLQVYGCRLGSHFHLGHMTRQQQVRLTLVARCAL